MKASYGVIILVLMYLAFPQTIITGIWVHGYGQGYLNREEARRMVDYCHKNHINSIFIQVRKLGDAYYKSETEPRATNISQAYDPLKYVLELAKQKEPRISVHAWLVLNKVSSRAQENQIPSNHILRRHPEWIMRLSNGEYYFDNGSTIWIDPALPQVQKYQADVVKEILKQYPEVDGIHLDYIRYPDIDSGYSDLVLQQFFLETGIDIKPSPRDRNWDDWRREKITQQVKRIYWVIQETNPEVLLSVAASCNYKLPDGIPSQRSLFNSSEPYRRYFQDWPSWLEDGIIDMACLMNYKRENEQWGPEYRRWVDFAASIQTDRLIVGGQGKFLKDNLPEDNLAQIEYIFQKNLDGVIVYNYIDQDALTDEKTYSLMREKVVPHPIPFRVPVWKKYFPANLVGGIIYKDTEHIYTQATITLSNEKHRFSTTSDGNGFFLFPRIPDGSYLIEVNIPDIPDRKLIFDGQKIIRLNITPHKLEGFILSQADNSPFSVNNDSEDTLTVTSDTPNNIPPPFADEGIQKVTAVHPDDIMDEMQSPAINLQAILEENANEHGGKTSELKTSPNIMPVTLQKTESQAESGQTIILGNGNIIHGVILQKDRDRVHVLISDKQMEIIIPRNQIKSIN